MKALRWVGIVLVVLTSLNARAELNNRRYFGGLVGLNSKTASGVSSSAFALMLEGGQRISESFSMGVYGYFSFASPTTAGVFAEPSLWLGASGWRIGADIGGEFGSSGRFLLGPMIGVDLDLNSNLAVTVESHFLFSMQSGGGTAIQPGIGLKYRFD